jgi:hypothetical protein
MTTRDSSTFPALSIRQPWADLILLGRKDIENRTWRTNFRGTVLIHASQRIDWDGVEMESRYLRRRGRLKATPDDGWEYDTTTSAIIGMLDIVDCVRRHRSEYFEGPYGFVLRNPVRFRRPIERGGWLNIFQVPRAMLRGTPAFRAQAGRSVTSRS